MSIAPSATGAGRVGAHAPRPRTTDRTPVPCATQCVDERLVAGKAWQDSGLVFTSLIGTALDPRNVTREFRALLTAAGVPAIRFPDLRHTAATLLLSQGLIHGPSWKRSATHRSA
jgi:integrase